MEKAHIEWIDWAKVIAIFAVVLRHYGADVTKEIDPTYPLTGILSGVPTMLIQDIPRWSLLSFFVVEMIYYPIGRHGLSGWLTAAIFATGGWALTLISDGGQLPLTIGPSVSQCTQPGSSATNRN